MMLVAGENLGINHPLKNCTKNESNRYMQMHIGKRSEKNSLTKRKLFKLYIKALDNMVY